MLAETHVAWMPGGICPCPLCALCQGTPQYWLTASRRYACNYATAPVLDISEHNAQFKASLAAAREWNIYYTKQAEVTDNQ